MLKRNQYGEGSKPIPICKKEEIPLNKVLQFRWRCHKCTR